MSQSGTGAEESYDCPSCEKSFSSKHGRKSHHTQVHGESLVDPPDGPQCPACGDTLPSEIGLKRHHKLAHGESLVNNSDGPECPTCGRNDFKNERGMKMHHKQMHGESLAGVEVECEWCGDALRVPPENHRAADRHFCKDDNCRSKWMESLDKTQSPRWSGGKQIYQCANCGSDVQRHSGNTHGENVFCDRDCYTSWKGGQMTGPNHFNWKGGSEPYYGEDWLEQRRRALKRDDHTCQSCGHSPCDGSRDLDVHHIRPLRTFDDPADANALDNLVSLCRSCHSTWEGVPVRPKLVD